MLYCRKQKLSREQLQIQIGDLEAKLVVLEAMQSSTDQDAKAYVAKLEKAQDTAATALQTQVDTIDSAKLDCMEARDENSKSTDAKKLCEQYR